MKYLIITILLCACEKSIIPAKNEAQKPMIILYGQCSCPGAIVTSQYTLWQIRKASGDSLPILSRERFWYPAGWVGDNQLDDTVTGSGTVLLDNYKPGTFISGDKITIGIDTLTICGKWTR